MKLILACDPNGGIGYQNKLPWTKIQGDLPRFKELTLNQVVIMGRNTWDTLPFRPLTNRLNLVVSSTPLDSCGAIRITDLSALYEFHNAWIIGGAKLVNSNWDIINEVHLTRVHAEYTCDTYVNLSSLQRQFSIVSINRNADHNYEVWRRDSW